MMMAQDYRPPYIITSDILQLVSEISRLVGELKTDRAIKPNPKLRRQNSILTIQGSLAIEGNSLSLEQVSAVLEGKRVLGKVREIQEVKNAITCYSDLAGYDPASLKSLLSAHRALMHGLIDRPGRLRDGAVGIFKGAEVAHVAPPAKNVPVLLEQLLGYLKRSKDPLLIKSCVFHYEFEFIHPFADGNGRVGRLWQTLILSQFSPVFEFLPVESQIHAHQAEYYRVLEVCDRKGDSSAFIEWMLGIILKTLEEFSRTAIPEPETSETRLEIAHQAFGSRAFTRLEYLRLIKTISAPTASRDLATATERKILSRTGDKRTARYRFRTKR